MFASSSCVFVFFFYSSKRVYERGKGEDLELVCNYDLEGDKLYSVKWYRNNQEFYRYIPTDNPSTAVFRQPGLIVNEYRSSETNIFLRRVDLMTTGLFK